MVMATQEQIDGVQRLIDRLASNEIPTQTMVDAALASIRDADGMPPDSDPEANITPADYIEQIKAGTIEHENLHQVLQDGFVDHIGERREMSYPKNAFGASAKHETPESQRTMAFQTAAHNPLDNILAPPKPGYDGGKDII